MSSERLKRATRTVSARLTVGYLLLLVFSLGMLYGLAAWNLSRALRQRDRDRIAMESQELVREYGHPTRAKVNLM